MENSPEQDAPAAIVYGRPPTELVEVPEGSMQCSPHLPGSTAPEELADASLDAAVVLAPPGTVERRFVIAQALRAARPGADVTVLAHNDKGGRRILGELAAFGCEAAGESRHHHRIARFFRPERLHGIDAAIEAGAPRFDEGIGFWTQAGVFAFDRVDPGSKLLIDHLPPLAGRGADLGCGIGVLSRRVLESSDVTHLAAIDIDRRAVAMAKRNLDDARMAFRWTNLRESAGDLADLDFAVSNPPFHDGGAEDRALGQSFIARAAAILRKGGAFFVVANRHLPYEAPLNERFARVSLVAENGGYKLFEARR